MSQWSIAQRHTGRDLVTRLLLESAVAAGLASFGSVAFASTASARIGSSDAEELVITTTPQETAEPGAAESSDSQTVEIETDAAAEFSDSGTDILSGDTLTILLDGRLVVANGANSFVDGGLGKTRFDGTDDGSYQFRLIPVEASLIWLPRFTHSLTANVSAAWQWKQENDVDLLEAFVSFRPRQTGSLGFSARAGLMWPEISLEHSTGGAWSVVNTITPSAINSWVGEEVKVLGAEATIHAGLGEHQLLVTGGAFGFNDTSGTLLSFRGWALHDEKATAFGHFPLPPLNEFIIHLQEDRTRSLIEIDKRVGFYGRLDWRPPWPFGAALFYYDNRGDPEAFEITGQWGWRTRFMNLGINANLGPDIRLLAQAMTGSTIMGFPFEGRRWVHTRFRSAYVLVSHQLDDRLAVTGRAEAFGTRERGSEMSRDESERGWALTAAARYTINDNLTLFVEALNNRSRRGTRANLGLRPFQPQTVFQAALRIRL